MTTDVAGINVCIYPVKSVPGTFLQHKKHSPLKMVHLRLLCIKSSTFGTKANTNYSVLHSNTFFWAHSINLSNTVLQLTVNLYLHILLQENYTASKSLWNNKNIHTAVSLFWFHTHETFLPYTVINRQPHYGMSDRRKTTKRSTAKAMRN